MVTLRRIDSSICFLIESIIFKNLILINVGKLVQCFCVCLKSKTFWQILWKTSYRPKPRSRPSITWGSWSATRMTPPLHATSRSTSTTSRANPKSSSHTSIFSRMWLHFSEKLKEKMLKICLVQLCLFFFHLVAVHKWRHVTLRFGVHAIRLGWNHICLKRSQFLLLLEEANLKIAIKIKIIVLSVKLWSL